VKVLRRLREAGLPQEFSLHHYREDMFKRIVVPIDGSASAEKAFDVAMRLAKSEGAQLAVCSVVDPITVASVSPMGASADILIADMEQEAQREVDGAVATARREGIDASGTVLNGVAYNEILSYTKRQNADAIVMGTHGRGGLQRLFLGSVAESVLREAPCPVIVVRDEAKVSSAAATSAEKQKEMVQS
jgi:nucleotide-binding universal stress UspA family protein